MLHRYASRLHYRMIANGVQAPSVDVIVYALNIVYNTLSIIGLTALIGLLTGEFVRTLIVLITFAVIRFLTGGYHLKSGTFCIVVSTIVMSILPHLYLDQLWTLIVTTVALVLVLIFAPANYDKYARISEKYYPHLKLLAAAVVASNYFFVYDAIAISFVVAGLLLPFKEGGE